MESMEWPYLERFCYLGIAACLRLQSSVGRIKPSFIAEKLRQVLNLLVTSAFTALSLHMPKQELLCKDTAGRIDRQFQSPPPPVSQLGHHIREQRRGVRSGLVALLPEIALQVLEVGDFDIAGGEVFYMGLKSFGRFSMGFREGITVSGKGWV